MKAQTQFWTQRTGWFAPSAPLDRAQLVVYFGPRAMLGDPDHYSAMVARFPGAHIVGCSTGGQIADGDVNDDALNVLAMKFDATTLRVASRHISDSTSSRVCGEALGAELHSPDLRHVFILSDGILVNGTELVAGVTACTGRNVTVTGGLAGDGASFQETLVTADAPPAPGIVVAVGFYGDALVVGHGCVGGWDEFGPKRRITRAVGNVLYDLDGRPALDLYKKYLGEEADGLPGAGLLYPLLVYDPAAPEHKVVRTILGVDDVGGSMTFAGNVNEGWVTQFMQGRFDRLAEGAGSAMRAAMSPHADTASDVASILVSCIGRRILMGQSIIDEILSVQSACRENTKYIGFYSYGEIAPHDVSQTCELHNQSMTVTTLSERV